MKTSFIADETSVCKEILITLITCVNSHCSFTSQIVKNVTGNFSPSLISCYCHYCFVSIISIINSTIFFLKIRLRESSIMKLFNKSMKYSMSSVRFAKTLICFLNDFRSQRIQTKCTFTIYFIVCI